MPARERSDVGALASSVNSRPSPSWQASRRTSEARFWRRRQDRSRVPDCPTSRVGAKPDVVLESVVILIPCRGLLRHSMMSTSSNRMRLPAADCSHQNREVQSGDDSFSLRYQFEDRKCLRHPLVTKPKQRRRRQFPVKTHRCGHTSGALCISHAPVLCGRFACWRCVVEAKPRRLPRLFCRVSLWANKGEEVRARKRGHESALRPDFTTNPHQHLPAVVMQQNSALAAWSKV